jgi:hypothetical protein
MEANVSQIKNMLARSIWSNQDIMAYVGCSKTKASSIRQKAVIEHKGYVESFPKKVRRDAVLAALGIDLKTEVWNIKIIEGV